MSDIISHIGLLFTPLAILSLLGAAIIIERLVFFIRLPALAKAESFVALHQELVANAKKSKALRDELLSFRLAELRSRLLSGVQLLRMIAVLSPMLGLLGTVIGMIEAFEDIAQQTGPIAPNMIAEGLWSAMLTTAYGLSIALPCLFAAFIYARIAEKRIEKMQQSLNAKSLEIEGIALS